MEKNSIEEYKFKKKLQKSEHLILSAVELYVV